MFEVIINAYNGEQIVKVSKTEQGAKSVLRYWLRKFDGQGVGASGTWREI